MTGAFPLRVLVAEDDLLASLEIVRMVGALGWECVHVAIDGKEAVAFTESLQPDGVLMDIEMPKMGGLEAAREILEKCPTTLVVLSAYDDDDLVAKAARAGVSAYLLKPPQPREVLRAFTIARSRRWNLATMQRRNDLLRARNDHLEAIASGAVALKGTVSLCARCRNVPGDDGRWRSIEEYVMEHSPARFSHTLCPACEGGGAE